MPWFRNRDHLFRCPVTGTYHDPMVASRALYAGEYGEWSAAANKGDDASLLLVTNRAREVFSLPPVSLNGRGVSEAQVLQVLRAFDEYLRGKGKRGGTSPTSVASTASPDA